MASLETVMKSGHPPTLVAAFLYFGSCFAIWVLNGAMGPYITKAFSLTPSQTGLMISVPTLAGALAWFPLGVRSGCIERKNAAMAEMSCIILAMLVGYFFVNSFSDVLAMGALLGIAGASFGVALSLGSGWLAKGTVLSAPMLPLIVMAVFAKEPPDRVRQSSSNHLRCLWQSDGWAFNLIYLITFGGFVGLSIVLPTVFHEQFGVTPIAAVRLIMLVLVGLLFWQRQWVGTFVGPNGKAAKPDERLSGGQTWTPAAATI